LHCVYNGLFKVMFC